MGALRTDQLDSYAKGSIYLDTPVSGKSTNAQITCWLLDTRTLWPGTNIFSASGAAAALCLISLPEQNIVTTKIFISDARMSLASALLKRLFITKTLGIPWKDIKLGRKGNKKHGKPCAVDDVGRPIEGIDFNVSHQNGLVALIGWDGRRTHRHNSPGEGQVVVGVDIVCVNERDDFRTIDSDGFDGWIDIYDAVFSDDERWSMKYDADYVTLLDGSILSAADLGRHDRCIVRNKDISITTQAGRQVTFNSELLIEAKLRRFYTYFCYKEAYIKLAGEALLAPWLKDLEFHNVRSPRPGTPARCSTHGVWGEEVEDVEIQLHGKEVRDVRMKIQAFEEAFMISVALQGDVEGLVVPAFKTLELESEVLGFAVEHLEEKDETGPAAKMP